MGYEGPKSPEQASPWQRPDLLQEKGELMRTAKMFAPDEDFEALALRMYEALQRAPLRELSDEDWSRLENTDSWNIAVDDFDAVDKFSEEYHRDWKKFYQSLKNGIPIPAPTIVDYDGRLHKVGGNTRLMVAKAMGIRPMVLIAKVEKTA